jgi:hypothetical protein
MSAAPISSRPPCVSCGRSWVPPEGVDAATHACPACAHEWRALSTEEKMRIADVVLVRSSGVASYRVAKDANGALSEGAIINIAQAVAVRARAGRVLFLNEQGAEVGT